MMNSIEKIELKVAEITPYERNNKKHPPEQIEALALQIKEHGYDVFIVVDENNVILKGHARLKAIKKLKWKRVEVIRRLGLAEATKRAIRIADNKLSELGEWDLDNLQFEMDGILADGVALGLTGFDRWPEGDGDAPSEGLTDPDDVPEVDEKAPATVQRGEVWLLGNHRLMCGDSTSEEDVARLMGGMKADMCFTSPPYNAGVSAKLSGNTSIGDNLYQGEYDDNNSAEDYFFFLRDTTQNALRHSRYVFWNIQFLAGNRTVIPEWWYTFKKRICDVAVWDKGHAQPAAALRVLNSVFEFIFVLTSDDDPCRAIRIAPEFRGTIDNIFRIPPQRNNEYASIHAATFPVVLPETFVGQFCPEGGSVLDLFSGTGTTLIACENTGRRCYGMEISPHYCDVIIKRWEDFTGKKAVHT